MDKYKEKTWDDLSLEDEEFLQSLDNLDDEAIKNSIMGYTTWMNKQFEEQLRYEIAQAKVSICIPEFEQVLQDANEIYQKHIATKGESWKTWPIDFLNKKLTEELDEFDTSRHKYEELLDVINVCLMLAERLRKGEG